MDNLNIERFNPRKAEITELVERIKSTVISMPGDKTGYELMKENKKTLQSARTNLTKDLKAEREGALAYQKGIIAIEKDMLAIIEPVESELDEKIKAIEDAEKRAARVAILPDRKEKLKSIELEMTDGEILDMDDKVFAQFFTDKKMAYLEAQNEKARKIEEDRRREEDEKRHQEEIKKASEQAAANAKKEAEEKAEREKKEAVQREKDKAERAKQKLIDEQAQKERDRIAAEEKAERDKQAQIAKEKAEAEKLEKTKKYQKFLADNGCTKETESEFYIKKEETKVVLYKKVGEFKI